MKKASLLSIFILLTGVLSSAQTFKKQGKYFIPVNVAYVIEKHSSFTADLITDSVNGKSSFVLTISNPDKNKLKISLQHPYEGEIYTKEITDSLYRNRFDFSQAEDGEYVLTINNGKEKLKKRILIHTETAISRQMEVN